LEGSKAFTKALCAEFNIPTAAYATFDDVHAAKAYIKAQGAPIVIKADGLAAGKGVVVAENEAQALEAVDQLLTPELGGRIVIEECLIGEEVSFFALCDGRKAIPIGAAQDHKRAYDGDLGPNTGGMGAYSPAPCFDNDAQDQVMADIIQPTLAAMAKRGYPFSGILFAGLMMTKDGPKLIEFNVRLGDPETQVLLMRLADDPLPAFFAAAKGDMGGHRLTMGDQSALVVVMAAKGYPGTPKTGTRIGLPHSRAAAESVIFHAGTGLDADGNLIAKGGRVLSICARGPKLVDACRIAYDLIDQINWPDGFYRRDIGHKALKPE
jgi:phosphoribosylamine--glycine ligase